MPKIITAQELLSLESYPVLDVRSPGEYQQGHIPTAHHLPLFSDAERAEVGTLYKQDSPDAALLRGLELSGAKMRQYVEKARAIDPKGPMIIHCWRGGQRSQSMGWLLEKAGLEVWILQGGYKAYRQYIRTWLGKKQHQFIVLSGPTGAGKTHLLHALQEQGEWIVDLENLACHKGSAFGALGEAPQPSTEHFENLLQAELRRIPSGSRVWLEDESRLIGTVYLPDPFWDQLDTVQTIDLEVPFEERVQNLVADYSAYPLSDLRKAFQKITKRLGGQNVKAALEALEQRDFATAAAISLRYYDKAYARSKAKRRGPIRKLQFSGRDFKSASAQLLELIP